MNFDLSGRVVLVTGASGNIGAAICRKLGEQGAIAVAADITGAEGIHRLDVTDEPSWIALVAQVKAMHGRLDVLVNNAGIAPMGKLEDVTLAEWRRCQAINVEGVFLGMKSAVALLRESGARLPAGASIVNLASAASNRATAYASCYATSKAAVAMLSKSAGIEFARLGYPIRVNSVHPTSVRSTMIDDILVRFSEITGGVPVADLEAAMKADQPMGRLVEPDEVADAVLFLASDASGYVTASELNVDGGLTAG